MKEFNDPHPIKFTRRRRKTNFIVKEHKVTKESSKQEEKALIIGSMVIKQLHNVKYN